MNLTEIKAIIASIETAEDETDRLRQYAAVLNEISPPPELADKTAKYFDYESTPAEAQLIKDMIREKIQEEYHQTPQEFCDEFYGSDDLRNEHMQDSDNITIGGLT